MSNLCQFCVSPPLLRAITTESLTFDPQAVKYKHTPFTRFRTSIDGPDKYDYICVDSHLSQRDLTSDMIISATFIKCNKRILVVE